MFHLPKRRWIAAAVLLAAAGTAHAAPRHFRVGAGCTYATIQAALDAERANPGSPADFIWVARNQSYSAQDVQIHDQNVFVYGGVDDCVDTSVSGMTTLSGSGGAAKSVMTISGRSQVWLGGLNITQGDNNDSGVGGGINFVGTGLLKIGSSTITNNRAGYGGGVNFHGTGGSNDVAELWINAETLVTNNTATTSGGGIRIEGDARLRVVDPQVWIARNHALGGYGGGVMLLAPASADLGSPGYRFAEQIALIYANTATYGGGVSVNSGGVDQDAHLRLFATDPVHPVAIEGNSATRDGGGIYAFGHQDTGLGFASVCGNDFRIAANFAREGSALYAANYGHFFQSRLAQASCLVDTTALGAQPCTAQSCAVIEGNVAMDASGVSTDGSTILLGYGASFVADRLSMNGNQGEHAIRVLDYGSMHLGNALLYAGQFAGDSVKGESGSTLSLSNVTIADNEIGSGAVIASAGRLTLLNDILAQPGTTSLAYAGQNPAQNLSIDYVMSTETSSLGLGTHIIGADPLFAAPEQGNFRLQPGSPAIDLAPTEGNDPLDLDGNPREVILLASPHPGVRDLGAYERQLRYCGAADTMFCDGFGFD